MSSEKTLLADADTVLAVEGISKRYVLGASAPYRTLRESVHGLFSRDRSRPPELWALRDVGFRVRRGEMLGLVGRNGAGKSTLLKVLSRITEPTSGRAVCQGRLGALLEVGAGFHPELTGRENVFLNGAILGMTRSEIRDKFDSIVAFSEVEEVIDTPVKRYSSGMYLRLAFSIAAHLEPDLMLVDEVLAVGDARFWTKSIEKMRSLNSAGMTIVVVTHNMWLVQTLCTRAICLDHGRVVADGAPLEVIAAYRDVVRASPPDASPEKEDAARITGLGLEPLGKWASEREALSDSGVAVTIEGEVPEGTTGHLLVRVTSPDGFPFFTVYSPALTSRHRRVRGVANIPRLMLMPGDYLVWAGICKRDDREQVMAAESVPLVVAADRAVDRRMSFFWNEATWSLE